MVTELETMMVERLQLYRSRNGGALPARVLVYRDGVSEVGLSDFRKEQLADIYLALSRVNSRS